MEHKNYLIYFDGDDIAPENALKMLNEQFGSKNVVRLNSSTNFAIKVSENLTFSEIQEKIGFSKSSTETFRGIIVEMLSGYRNGLYSRDFWDFLRTPVKEKEDCDA